MQMPEKQQSGMSLRALMTELDRERIANEDTDEPEYRYQAISRTRRKINEELPKDVEVLRNHHPELYEELKSVVCNTEVADQ